MATIPEIQAWLAAHPLATDYEIGVAARDAGATIQQLSIATGLSTSEVHRRLAAVGIFIAADFSQQVAPPAPAPQLLTAAPVAPVSYFTAAPVAVTPSVGFLEPAKTTPTTVGTSTAPLTIQAVAANLPKAETVITDAVPVATNVQTASMFAVFPDPTISSRPVADAVAVASNAAPAAPQSPALGLASVAAILAAALL